MKILDNGELAVVARLGALQEAYTSTLRFKDADVREALPESAYYEGDHTQLNDDNSLLVWAPLCSLE